MCPILGPTGLSGICTEWTDVGWNNGNKGYTSSFYENRKDCISRQGTGKTLISTIQKIDSLLIDYSQN
jgi:hypothetical protein